MENFGRGNDRFPRKKFSPVRVGEEVDVLITAEGKKGDGLATRKGFVLFIPNAKEGEKVRVKVTRVLNKVGFAEVIGPAQSEPEPDIPPDKNDSQDSDGYGDDSQNNQSQDSNYSDDEEPRQQADESEEFGEDSEDFGEERKH